MRFLDSHMREKNEGNLKNAVGRYRRFLRILDL